MNPDQLVGYHSEWNLVCPGGCDYQRMAQERGKLCWNRRKAVLEQDQKKFRNRDRAGL
jgi:hypothetical protein